MSRSHFPRAFTLVELLVVVAIIGLLISILLPALSKAKDAARAVVCQANLHQIHLGVKYYQSDFKNWVPPEKITGGPVPTPNPWDDQQWPGFRHFLVDYTQKAGNDTDRLIWSCPSDNDPAATNVSYGLNTNLNDSWNNLKARPSVVFKGVTITFFEVIHPDQLGVSPSEDVFVADSEAGSVFINSNNVIDTALFARAADFRHGTNLPLSNTAWYGAIRSTRQEYIDAKGKANGLYLDGHVDAYGQQQLMDNNGVEFLQKYKVQ